MSSEPMTVADEAMTSIHPEPAMLERFDSMLRALITFGLVEREPGGDGAEGSCWRLVPEVQGRLASLFIPSPPAEKLIYFGHRCGGCGEHGPTWFSSGVFLCEACRDPADRNPTRSAQGA